MITIEDLERLAHEAIDEQIQESNRLRRLIRAYSKLIWAHDPDLFVARALEYGDEAGHYDNSYPPKQEYRDRRGPRLIKIRSWDTKDLPTSTGFYYHWRRVTEDPGLYVDAEGDIYGCEETGTGELGSFAAHPGDCNVSCALEWSERHDLTLDDVREVEKALRAIVAEKGIVGRLEQEAAVAP